ncbi:cytochrome b [uncultured Shewanella sp.]|uniref:cytochrome b n=1 Tax=uncultured Shewanella sp. TaxID=173975 RepID=UPI00261019C8|nr:cytochrome b [uncultured Shewanella sp.]
MKHQHFKNTEQAYGRIAKWIHWSVAILFLLAYVSVYYRQWFTEEKTPENWNALQVHLSVGVTIGVLVLLRIIWKLINVTPRAEPGTPMEHLAAKLGHYALYLVMLVMPLTGYMGTGANTEFFFLFDISKFADTWIYQALVVDGLNSSFEAIEPTMDFIHKEIGGKWLVWILILGHAMAAMYHHFVKRDNTLKRML